jgi:hypothetical protein
MDNIYYSPEKFGLTVVGVGDEEDMSYEFDTFAVWTDENGRYYWASDSGCSCPAPFENYYSLDDLYSGTKQDALNDLNAWIGDNRNRRAGSKSLLSSLA